MTQTIKDITGARCGLRALREAVGAAWPSKRPPLYDAVALVADGDLRVVGTDLRTWVRVDVPATVTGSWGCLVSPEVLSKLLKGKPDVEVGLGLRGDVLHLELGLESYDLPVGLVDDYPLDPTGGAVLREVVPVDWALGEACGRALAAVDATGSWDWALSYLHLSEHRGVPCLVGLDLGCMSVQWLQGEPLPETLLMPTQAAEALRALGGRARLLEFWQDLVEGYVTVVLSGAQVTWARPWYTPAKWRRALETATSGQPLEALVDAKMLGAALRALRTSGRSHHHLVRLWGGPWGLRLVRLYDGQLESQCLPLLECEGEWQAQVSLELLLAAVGTCRGEVDLTVWGPLGPLTLEQGDNMWLIMPATGRTELNQAIDNYIEQHYNTQEVK